MNETEKAIKHMKERLRYAVVATAIDVPVVRLAIKELEAVSIPKPIEEWDEDYGDCLWWSFPVEEPPYCGSPLDVDFPDYVTHFTQLILPISPINME